MAAESKRSARDVQSARRRSTASGWRAATVLAALGLPLLAVAAGLTPREEAGRKIYREGVSPSGSPIRAFVGPKSVEIDGRNAPCGNCHGFDGLGRAEGGVKPPVITWRELVKSYGHRHENGREHPAFDEKSVAEAMTFGTDPAGNKMDPSMPRYVMSNKDMADLIAYLKKIESDLDPGIGSNRLRIGTLLPTGGRLGELGQVVAGVMQAYVDDVNARGGIFGRRVDLVKAEFSDDRKATLAAAERLMRRDNVFAVVGPFSIGIENEISRLAEEAQVPVIGPFTLLPESVLAINRYTYYLMPGLREQAVVLARFAATGLGIQPSAVAIVYPGTEAYAEVAGSVEQALKEQGWDKAVRAPYEAGRQPDGRLVADLQQQDVRVVIFLGSDSELSALGAKAGDANWSPYLLAPGTKVARSAVALPASFGERVFLAFPTLPQDVTPSGGAALAGLEKKGQAGSRHQPAQISAYASLRVLEEGLRQAGRDLNRAKFGDSLENLFNFESGVTPAISFGPSRRVGISGAHIVRVDPTSRSFLPVGKFVGLE